MMGGHKDGSVQGGGGGVKFANVANVINAWPFPTVFLPGRLPAPGRLPNQIVRGEENKGSLNGHWGPSGPSDC